MYTFSNPTNDSPKKINITHGTINRKSLNDVNEDFSIGNMYYFGTHGMQDYDLSIKLRSKEMYTYLMLKDGVK
jgi:hypothetical protein